MSPSEPSDPPGASSDAPGGKPSRAGRNLTAAIAVGLAIGAVILLGLFTAKESFIGIVAVSVGLATVELARALKRAANIQIALLPVLLGGQAMIWLSWPFGRDGLLACFVLTVLVCMVWRFRGGTDGYLRDLSASVLILAYLPLFGAFGGMLAVPADGAFRALAYSLGVVASDTGGYVAGVLFGKHSMAPSISPKKSWEGLAGSLLAGIVTGVLTLTLGLHGLWWQGAIFGAAVVITSTVGDLVESLIKRDLGIKDMGHLLPGHGGAMDRMDSLLPSAVVSWLLLSWFIPVS